VSGVKRAELSPAIVRRDPVAIAGALAVAIGLGGAGVAGPREAGGVPLQAMPFRPGMVVTESTRIDPGLYEVPGPASLDDALIVVRGDGITLDLTGVELRGQPVEADPDLAAGVAIRVDGGAEVTIRNATVRGYRFAILARGTRNLRLLDNELSYNWKPRLFSLIGHESLVDWLSFHDNEEREWMRFGAAIYLEDVEGGEIAGNRAVQGMNGLLMTRSNDLAVRDNELAFNSGLGIGLYRSSGNRIEANRLDYNVRGYSHGFYQRGQDSAAILLYEQSNDNVIAFNSATHSGDGLFLWAGRSTMDTGEGGANDNRIFGNDFSFAPTNAVEVTFSRNTIVANRLSGSRYGVWGGYSFDTTIAGNCIEGNEFGIAIEHGQDNLIDRNRLAGNGSAVELWANPSEPADWGYPRHRDTRSRDNRVVRNQFAANERLWRLQRTAGLEIADNLFAAAAPERACDPLRLLGGDLLRWSPGLTQLPGVDSWLAEPGAGVEFRPGRPGVPAGRLAELAARDRAAIVVDEWGPYDWRSPKLWPRDEVRDEVHLRVLGPPGEWRVLEQPGVARLSAPAGRTGDVLVVRPAAGRTGDWAVALEYSGEEVTSPRGTTFPAGAAVPFAFERFEPVSGWQVRFHAWTDPARDPAVPAGAEPAAAAGGAAAAATEPGRAARAQAFATVLAGQPVFTRSSERLDYQWYRPPIAELPQERWALEAVASVDLPAGEYSLRTISDDGVRVWVDGELVIDNWDEPHGSMLDYAPLAAGEHELRVRYYQLGGWTELRVEVVKGSARSPGSAGPH